MHRKRKDFSRAADLGAHKPNGYHGYGEIGGTKDESRILTFSNAWPPKPSETNHLTSLQRMQTSVSVLNERIELMQSLCHEQREPSSIARPREEAISPNLLPPFRVFGQIVHTGLNIPEILNPQTPPCLMQKHPTSSCQNGRCVILTA